MTVKSKTLKNRKITKGILKSSKTKQTLYDKFLKSKTYEHEMSYKNYRKLFESIKQSAKSQYYSKMLLHYKDNIKKTWQMMKQVIGKGNLRMYHSWRLPMFNLYFHLYEGLIKTDLRLLIVDTASVYLKVSVVKNFHHVVKNLSFSIALMDFILKL